MYKFLRLGGGRNFLAFEVTLRQLINDLSQYVKILAAKLQFGVKSYEFGEFSLL